MLQISAVIITLNAERRLRQVLSALDFADETIVVDSGSTDSTIEICRDFGVRLITREWEGYGRTKNHAIGLARSPWVLSVDADEVVSGELRREIEAIEPGARHAGFRIPRLNHYFGRALHHGGQYPDYQLRLFRAGHGRFNERPVHESLSVEGEVGTLGGPLLHYTYDTLEDYLDRFARYTRLEAIRLHGAGVRHGPAGLARGLLLRPARKFVWRYLCRRGFLDGVPGLLAALFNSMTIMVSHARLWELNRRESAPENPDNPQ